MVLINSNKTLGESLHYIVSQAARLTEAEDAIIFRKDDETAMTILATNPGGQIRYSPNVGLAAITVTWAESALLMNKPLILPDLNAYWRANPNVRSGSFGSHKAMLGIPIVVEEAIYGGLIMLYDHERTFVDEDLDLGFTFADQATLAIANNHLREQAEQIAVATERSRLARELHDAVTQTIFSASLIAETVPSIWAKDKEEGELLLQDLRQLTRGALAEMRTLLLELRPAALEETALSDLLNQLAEAVGGRTGIDVEVETEHGPELPVSGKVALYRIAQESLNNIIKHARASKVELSLSYPDNGCVELTIRDDGRGFDMKNVPSDRLGLRSMRERADSIGANLTIRSVLREGTEVSVKLSTQD
jgi:two-component system nitrate/nitrite sensor histidine kinase NarX